MRNAEKITNTAYILLLIREGKVKSWEDLCRHFGLDPEFSDTMGYTLRESLASLKSAQLIDYSESSSSAAVSGFTVLPLLEKIQNCLNISVSELAASLERDRMVVSPLFGRADSHKYKADIFVLMPFSQPMAPLYHDHLKTVATALGMTIARADDFFTSAEIMTEVWAAIANARLLVADCTGRNPNVFYEIGLAHAIGKPVIIITQNQDDVPFDLQHRRYIQYEFTPRGMKNFEDTLTKTIRSITEDDDAA